MSAILPPPLLIRTIQMTLCASLCIAETHTAMARVFPIRPSSAPSASSPSLSEAAKHLIEILRAEETETKVRRVRYNSRGEVEYMMLSTHNATDLTLRLLPEFPDLSHLTINCSLSGITPNGIAELGKLHHLANLEIRAAAPTITPEFGAVVGQMRDLVSLRIQYSKVDADALKEMGASPLVFLGITDTKEFSDRDASVLSESMMSLEELDLSRTGISNACLPPLSRLPKLKRLIVRGTSVTMDAARNAGLRDVQVVGAAGRDGGE